MEQTLFRIGETRMTDAFDLTTEDQQENIREFIQTHGSEGFFTLYFRQLFYRYVKQELKSATEELDDVGQQLYFSTEGDELLTQHREELLEQCEERARELVEDLKADPEFRGVIEEGDIERFSQLDDEFIAAVHQRFEEWKVDGIALLEDVETEADTESSE